MVPYVDSDNVGCGGGHIGSGIGVNLPNQVPGRIEEESVFRIQAGEVAPRDNAPCGQSGNIKPARESERIGYRRIELIS
jgi:hypothetical protein